MMTQTMKKLVALSLLSVTGTGVAEAAMQIDQIIGWADYDNSSYAMQTGPATYINASTAGNTWQENTNGKYGGRAGTAGDGSAKITYSSLPSGFSSNAGMVEFWFNTDNSWAGLYLLDMGNGNQISWNAGSQLLTAATTGNEVLNALQFMNNLGWDNRRH